MRLVMLIVFFPVWVFGQEPVVSAFPSLRLSSSSRGLAMGDGGIAGAVENQQLVYNAAKSAFTQNFHQASASYLPLFTSVARDMKLMNVNYLANVGNHVSFGASVNYMGLGSVPVRDNNGALLAMYKGSEYNLGASVAVQLFEKMAFGVTLRAIGAQVYTSAATSVLSGCADVSYYQYVEMGDVGRRLEWGAVVSNLGPKVSASGASDKTALPASVGVGVGYSVVGDDGGTVSFSFDAKKLLAEKFNAVRLSFVCVG
eukprot:TRINITY_DN10247_c0_g1_i1.p1 TRINITY_DN10247_c0_g1~~TRINITY_DN10247_c0_g1_i1.p1  ORF type:complete len:257 (-),score=17.02 TRINITY_DN10247_c0_g1_i1:7-777(-)